MDIDNPFCWVESRVGGMRERSLTIAQRLWTSRLLLRPFGDKDQSDLADILKHSSVSDMLLDVPPDYDLEHAATTLKYYQEETDFQRGYYYAIQCRGPQGYADGPVIGAISLRWDIPKFSAELGYFFHPSVWGKGYCTEASLALMWAGFQQLKISRIFARHIKGNERSGRVMEKLGMQFEGHLRQHILVHDKLEDTVYFGILKPEFIQVAASYRQQLYQLERHKESSSVTA
ncbi:MAG: GNAT family protein [Pseudomonadota bacterium]